MQTFDTYTYFNGASAAIYFIVCLICGLQLCFDILKIHKHTDTLLSRMLGWCLLLMSCSAVCYILSDTFETMNLLLIVGYVIDLFMVVILASMSYVLYSNNKPSMKLLAAYTSPFILIVILFFVIPDARKWLFVGDMAMLAVLYLVRGIMLRRRELMLHDLYANPDSHSLRWVNWIVLFAIGWLALYLLFAIIPSINAWFDVALYLYMTVMVMYAFAKITNFGEPISLETQLEMETEDWKAIPTSVEESNPLKMALVRLLEDERIYLIPDLTVENVVKRLGTNSKYFSAMLHNDLNTTFYKLINSYRIEYAKTLLRSSDDKVEYIATLCGYNSRQSFHQSFTKITGMTPSEWRNQ